MAPHKIIVIGASAGGVEASMQLVRPLPATLNASIFIVLHIPSHSPSLLPQILGRVSALTVVHPQDMEVIQAGKIYVAPPDYHLLVGQDYIELSKGAKVNNARPAIDTLFVSAALSHTKDVIGVVLTGMLDDGSMGLAKIKQYGGTTIVQDPHEAMYASMPRNAMRRSDCDYVLTLSEISEMLIKLVELPIAGVLSTTSEQESGDLNDLETASKLEAFQNGEEVYQMGKPAIFSCPDCGGVLAEIKEDEVPRYVCRVGHSYSLNWLMAMQGDNVEKALWTALRALDEAVSSARDATEQEIDEVLKQAYLEKAEEYERQAAVLRTMFLK